MHNNLLKNKTVQFVIGLSLGILILVTILSPKRSINPAGNPLPSSSASSLSPSLINLSEQKKADATNYLSSVSAKFPLSHADFATSVGITTNIDIYRLDSDPAGTIRLDITGLSYLNKDAAKNPNAIAYKESYTRAMNMIEGVNVDPTKLVFIYSDIGYVSATTQAWIDALKLKP